MLRNSLQREKWRRLSNPDRGLGIRTIETVPPKRLVVVMSVALKFEHNSLLFLCPQNRVVFDGRQTSLCISFAVSEEDLDRAMSFLSGDADLADLINGEMPGPMSFLLRQDKVCGGNDLGVLEFIAIFGERERLRKWLARSCATGLTPDDYSRYVERF